MSDSTRRLAVVDIGSNTVKLTVYACAPGGTLAALEHSADTVRVGYRLTETGVIADDRLERLIEGLRRYEALARGHGADTFLAVATQAFRLASNTAAVIEEVEAATAWRIRVLSGEEETRLTIEGARPWLVPGEWNVVADIGGASTEIIAVSPDREISSAGSHPIGSGLLFDEEIGSSPPPEGSLERCISRVSVLLAQQDPLPPNARNLLLPGGTGYYLEQLIESIAPAQSFDPLALGPLHDWLGTQHAILTMERIPVQYDRALVLPASLAIVEALVLRLGPQKLEAVPSGIRDGIARQHCSRH